MRLGEDDGWNSFCAGAVTGAALTRATREQPLVCVCACSTCVVGGTHSTALASAVSCNKRLNRTGRSRALCRGCSLQHCTRAVDYTVLLCQLAPAKSCTDLSRRLMLQMVVAFTCWVPCCGGRCAAACTGRTSSCRRGRCCKPASPSLTCWTPHSSSSGRSTHNTSSSSRELQQEQQHHRQNNSSSSS